MSRTLRSACLVLAVLPLGAWPVTRAEPAGQEVALRAVKYDELTRTVRGLRGKVVVVDFWNHD